MSDRCNELDWLRVIAIVLLVFFHTARMFDMDGWHVKNNELTDSWKHWMLFLSSWRMPLLFFISGAGSYFAFRRSSAQHYFAERFKRLAIPFVFGMFVILPPQAFYQYRSEFNTYADVYRSFFDYIPYHNGDRALFHLWFLVYLFVYSLMGIPLLIWLRSEVLAPIRSVIMPILIRPIGLLLAPALTIMLPQLVLLPHHNEIPHLAFYITFFFMGMIYYHDPQYRNKIGDQRVFLLVAAVISAILFRMCQGMESLPEIGDYLSRSWILVTARAFTSWFWVMTLIGFAQVYLNKTKQWLMQVNEGIYPLFILHQTVIVVVGYYVCQWAWPISMKFAFVVVVTFVVCIGVYVLFIRPFDVMRFVFGLKRKPRLPVPVQA